LSQLPKKAIVSSMDKIVIYSDGGCTGNPGPGGWAAVILFNGSEIHLSGGNAATTNNQMELTAVIKALEYLLEQKWERVPIEIHTDSQYVQKGITQWIDGWIRKGWVTASKKPVKNRELWQILKGLDSELNPCWYWVKGHAGNTYNELCDQLVEQERMKFV
jgi:ribonuclease HI